MVVMAIFMMPLMGNTAVASDLTWYFNRYDNSEAWETNPIYMVDGDENTYASTTINHDVEYCNNNSYAPDHPAGTITKVEIRAKAYANSTGHSLYLRPVFGGTTDGVDYRFVLPMMASWGPWWDITDDPYGPGYGNWNWSDVESLDMDVEAVHDPAGTPPTIYCSMVKIRVTYS